MKTKTPLILGIIILVFSILYTYAVYSLIGNFNLPSEVAPIFEGMEIVMYASAVVLFIFCLIATKSKGMCTFLIVLGVLNCVGAVTLIQGILLIVAGINGKKQIEKYDAEHSA